LKEFLVSCQKVYLDSCASEFESIKRCSSLVLVIKRSSERFFYLFSEKVKFSREKYAVLQVRWFEYVREVLGSKEVRKIVEDSGKDGDVIRSIVSCYLESLWNVNLQYVSTTCCNFPHESLRVVRAHTCPCDVYARARAPY